MRSGIGCVLLIGACFMQGKDKPDPRLQAVNTVFIQGNNEAAQGARQTLAGNKTCLSLAPKADAADAVLEVSADAQRMGGSIGGLGGKTWSASGTLTLKSGDLVWSRSERFSDAPFKSGGKTAGDLMIRHLAEDAACKARREKK